MRLSRLAPVACALLFASALAGCSSDMNANKGEQTGAAASPARLKLNPGGELKAKKPYKAPATGMGNHIHVILDNQPYEAYYNLDQPFELRNVQEGKHTIRVFPSRPWHESYKNEGAFQMVTFTVKGGGDASKPTTTNAGEKMADQSGA